MPGVSGGMTAVCWGYAGGIPGYTGGIPGVYWGYTWCILGLYLLNKTTLLFKMVCQHLYINKFAETIENIIKPHIHDITTDIKQRFL